MNNDQIDNHLQNAVFGIPLLKPDEQHRYLGTFLERVDLRITFAEALSRDFSTELAAEIHQHPDYFLLFHGKLDADILSRYIRLANYTNIRFAIKTDRFYHCEAQCSAVIFCADHAINVAQPDIVSRFPTSNLKQCQPQKSWFKRFLKH